MRESGGDSCGSAHLGRSYRDLETWQRAIDLACLCFSLVDTLPARVRFSLGDQIRRAALSVPANVAEGQGRRHRGDFARFLLIARGSLQELETLLVIASRQRYFSAADLERPLALCAEVGRLVSGLRRSLVSPPRN